MSRRRDPKTLTEKADSNPEDSKVLLRNGREIWLSTWVAIKPLLTEIRSSEEGKIALFTIRQQCRASRVLETWDQTSRDHALRILNQMSKDRGIDDFRLIILGSVRGESPEEIFIISPIAGDSTDPI